MGEFQPLVLVTLVDEVAVFQIVAIGEIVFTGEVVDGLLRPLADLAIDNLLRIIVEGQTARLLSLEAGHVTVEFRGGVPGESLDRIADTGQGPGLVGLGLRNQVLEVHTQQPVIRTPHLTGGVMVVNMNMHSDGEGSINAYLADTIAAVFPQVATVDVPRTTNRELFAAMEDVPLAQRLTEGLSAVTDGDLAALLTRVADHLTDYVPGAYLLTDDKAPVEVLGMRMIDVIIQDEVSYYKALYREQGLSGLMAAFS